MTDFGPFAWKGKATVSAGAAAMLTFLLWILLFVLCWPLALVALVLYPVVWILLVPFRLLGIAVDGVLELVRSVVLLPARILRIGRARTSPR